MRTPITILAALLIAGFAIVSPASARQNALSAPGYVDLSEFEDLVDSEATLEVNLSGAFLRMVTEAASFDEDEDLARLLRGLKGIFVRGYSLDTRQALALRSRVSGISSRLSDHGWERIVRVREDDEQVDVMVLATGDRIDGLTVLVLSPGSNETVFVNIVGEIRPEEIGRIGRRFRINALEDL